MIAGKRPRILIAPDSFKGTYDAIQVAEALARGVEEGGCVADLCPVADGGEGTSEILCRASGGQRLKAEARGPLGEPRAAAFSLIDGEAYVDLAEASGLALLGPDELDPLAATTTGTGELMVAALDAGAERIFVAAGGSATVDGGSGAIEAIIEAGGTGAAAITVLCDVETPFERAAKVFGPQKGADPAAVARLENRLDELARRWPHDPRGLPMSGAAGGFSGGLWAVLGARLLPGATYVLDRLRFESRLRDAEAVIVGEGSLDEQSFMGKIVGEISARAAVAKRPVHAVCGRSHLDPENALAHGLASIREAGDPAALTAAGREIATLLAAAP